MELGTDGNKNRRHREIVMSTHATSLPVTGQFLAAADAAKPSLGARLLGAIMAAQQRKADRRICIFRRSATIRTGRSSGWSWSGACWVSSRPSSIGLRAEMGEGFQAALWVSVAAVTLATAMSPFLIWLVQ